MENFKFDKTAFKGQTLTEASNHSTYYKTLHWKERLQITTYLNSIAYNFDLDNPPRLNKTKFSVKSLTTL